MDQLIGKKIIKRESLVSTNDYASELIKTEGIAEGTVVTAGYQTGGKGQHGNTWFGDTGKNLYFSIILYPGKLRIENQFYLSMAISLGVFDALSALFDSISLKWPNDIYYQDKKLGGILIENSVEGAFIKSSVAGIGINVNQQNFPSSLPNPVSVFQITGKESDMTSLLNIILKYIDERYQLLLKSESSKLKDDYLKILYKYDTYCQFEANGEIFSAKITDIKSTGELVIETTDGDKKSYWFKEIEYR